MDDIDNESDELGLIGRTVSGRYHVLRHLGAGGMGDIYHAIDERLKKAIVLKVLKEPYSRHDHSVARFTQEAKSAARIKHENVIDVTDYGKTEAGSYYIAMELLVGMDLATELAGRRTVDASRASRIAMDVCGALMAAHAIGVCHRDLKPENIFLSRTVDEEEVVKVIDFGIAQMRDSAGESTRHITREGTFIGTPEYMAPEQVRSAAIDGRADLYALGVVLFRMLAGRTPFWGENAVAQKLACFPPSIRDFNPGFRHEWLERVVRRALVRDRDFRFQSAQEMREALAGTLASVWPCAAPPGSPSAIVEGLETDRSPTEVSPPALTLLASHRLRTVIATNEAALFRLEVAARAVISAEHEPRWQDQWQHRLRAAEEFVHSIEGALLARLDRLLTAGPNKDQLSWIARRFRHAGRQVWAALLDSLPQPLPWGLRTMRKHLQGGLPPSLRALGALLAEVESTLPPEMGAHVAAMMGVSPQRSGDLIAAGALRNVLHHRPDYERDPTRTMEEAEHLLGRVEFRGLCCIDVPESTGEWLMDLAKVVVGRSDSKT
ncbi:MAG: serine/threonine-protein kinase [Deltaproteobacteria bacterium]|nr:serine/threonine-protein kinase [Myxococcales bacterium]MDP3213076.1 serine/threonine-protein kinase [Deltaproteobacteria bacterium]